MTEEFIDYSTILMRIEHTEKALHEACLERQYERVPGLADHLIEQAKKLKQWAAVQ